MSKTRAVRLSDSDSKQIDGFLSENSFFDFSSLARLAILQFIKNPQVFIKPLSSDDAKKPLRRVVKRSRQ